MGRKKKTELSENIGILETNKNTKPKALKAKTVNVEKESKTVKEAKPAKTKKSAEKIIPVKVEEAASKPKITRKAKESVKKQDNILSFHDEKYEQKLLDGLQEILDIYKNTKSDNSIKELKLIVFKLILQSPYKITESQELIKFLGVTFNAQKTDQSAVVSMDIKQFEQLINKVKQYADYADYFTQIEAFQDYMGEEKYSYYLRNLMAGEKLPKTINAQLILLPGLGKKTYESLVEVIQVKIKKKKGKIVKQHYYMADDTPIIPATIPLDSLASYENDPAIYRIDVSLI